MNETLWAAPASELLSRTASSDPTPGGGSISALTGAFGVGLMRMAVAITGDDSLDELDGRLRELQERIAAAVDADVADFEELLAAFRLPRADEEQQRERSAAIEAASVAATESPLALVEALADALELSHELEPRVKPGVVSDVLAGRDLAAGSARAALRTADLNLDQLDRLSSPRASGLRTRRDSLADRTEQAA